MILSIDTSDKELAKIALKEGDKIFAQKKFKAEKAQAEKLLPAIDNLLKKNDLSLKELKAIEVNDKGGSFSSLRIGVITANALGYALGIPVSASGKKPENKNNLSIVKPIYDREPV